MYAVCKNRFLCMKQFVWQSTPVQVTDPVTRRTRSVRPWGRPRHTVRGSGVQLEVDVGLTADAAWDMASDRNVWRAQRFVAGQAVYWVSELWDEKVKSDWRSSTEKRQINTRDDSLWEYLLRRYSSTHSSSTRSFARYMYTELYSFPQLDCFTDAVNKSPCCVDDLTSTKALGRRS